MLKMKRCTNCNPMNKLYAIVNRFHAMLSLRTLSLSIYSAHTITRQKAPCLQPPATTLIYLQMMCSYTFNMSGRDNQQG